MGWHAPVFSMQKSTQNIQEVTEKRKQMERKHKSQKNSSTHQTWTGMTIKPNGELTSARHTSIQEKTVVIRKKKRKTRMSMEEYQKKWTLF